MSQEYLLHVTAVNGKRTVWFGGRKIFKWLSLWMCTWQCGVLGFLLGLIWTTSALLAESHPADGDPFTVPLSPQLEANFLGFTCVLIPLPFLFLSPISLSEELLLQWHFPKWVLESQHTAAEAPAPGHVDRGETVWKPARICETRQPHLRLLFHR